MSEKLSSELVWKDLQKELFAVLGVVTASGEARTVGVVYIVDDKKIYVLTGKDTWKARHVSQNPHVSITIPIPKRIPFLPWIKIPSATISFSGLASIVNLEHIGNDIQKALTGGQEVDEEKKQALCVIVIKPVGDFISYGIGVPLMTMRDPEKARGRAAVA
jgi:hypothetical protein